MAMRNIVLLAVLTCLLAGAAAYAGGGVAGKALRVAATVAAGVTFAALWVIVFQGRMVFPRSRTPLNSWRPQGAETEEVRFRTDDGLWLHAWWHPGYGPGDPDRRPVLLWCHGNAGNITHREFNLMLMAHRGLACLLFDYRGYGRSDGRPSEHGLYRDADAAYRYLVDERGIPPERIIAFGRSLGAAVALDLALRRDVAGVVMESAFASVPAMAELQVPVVPVGWLMRYRFENLGRVGGLQVPLMMVHGDRDGIVPVRQGRGVFDVAPEPKTWYVIRDAGHNDTVEVGGEAYLDALQRFCSDCVDGRTH